MTQLRPFLLAAVSLFSFCSFTELVKINVDDFNAADMERAFKTQGTIELVGPSIAELRGYAQEAMRTAKEVLALPVDTLSAVAQQRDFHGFQNVKEESSAKGQTRNQIALHFKPYKEKRMPEGISDDAFHAYYEKGMSILHRLYNHISDAFGNRHRSDFSDDIQSILIARRYFSQPVQSATGIPPHSD